MRADLSAGPLPPAVWPAGVSVLEWSSATAGRFHAVYEAAFRERPGFPGWPADQWIAGTAEEDGFRPRWSLLAVRAAADGLGPGTDLGFVTAAEGWIDQVGVAPGARLAGVGTALIRESLTRMAADGHHDVWLNVNVDNPAAALYRRLGFAHRGRRARFRPGTA